MKIQKANKPNPSELPDVELRSSGAARCIGLIVCLVSAMVPAAQAQFTGSEDFSSSLRLDKWFPFTEGSGSLSLSNQEFNFTSSSSFGNHEAGLAWVSNPVTNTEDWEFQIDVGNALSVPTASRYGAVGIYVANLNDENDLAYLEFYSSYFNDLGQSVHGFTTGLKNNGVTLHEGDTFELPYDTGALRAKFDRSEKSLSFFFHTGPATEGYFWQFLAKYGLDGNDGTEANTNWSMPFNAEFDVGLYGAVVATRSSVGQLTADNFTADGAPLGVHEVDFELEATISDGGDSANLRWFSFEGLDYVIQFSPDLVSWSNFSTVRGTGTYSEQEVPLTTPERPAYYRIYSRIP